MLKTYALSLFFALLQLFAQAKGRSKSLRHTLKLIEEAKLSELLPEQESSLEASGVVYVNSSFYVVFDSDTFLAKIENHTHRIPENNFIYSEEQTESEFEGIFYDNLTGHLFLLQEAISNSRTRESYNAKIVEVSLSSDLRNYTPIESCFVNYSFKTDNKGLEGIHIFREDGSKAAYLLCEGNGCRGGKKGDTSRGVVLTAVYRSATPSSGCRWEVIRASELPQSLHFKDYSDLAISSEYKRVAVTTQQDSAVWITDFESVEEIDWSKSGAVYEFPRRKKNKIAYCNVEGIYFIKKNVIAVVSDKAKKKQSSRCALKDRMLHIFEIPELGGL